MPHFGRELPLQLRETFAHRRVDAIVHCGDMTDAMIVPLLEAIAPLEAVAGNNDPPGVVARFGRRKVLEIGSVRIGIVHGDAGVGRTTLERARNAFVDEAVDAVLFGHSHVPYCETHDGVLCFNPGSPTDKRRQPKYSFGVICISGAKIWSELVYYGDKRV